MDAKENRVESHLRSVAERAHEDDEDNTDVEVEEDFEHVLASASAKEVECIRFRI